MRNVYDDPAYSDIRKELHSELEELKKEYAVPEIG
ncbi:hypothetical protein H8E88_04850 [candidate division KSB1 bacterium]|nr:hypothetical protein [candidate division KSB1 bacterium]